MKEGRDAATLLEFLDALSQECAEGIEAVAIDMGLAYIAAVQKGLPSAAIVFDRFHVMQMFSKVIRDCRRAQFKEAKKLDDLTGQQTIKGSLWLLLSNLGTLKDSDQSRLDQLLAQNQPLATLYTLKEQLQRAYELFFPIGGPEGAGIGLAIARHIAEHYRGRAWAAAAAGRGTVLYLLLPRELGSDREEEP